MACVTHHHACTCREERFARLEAVARSLAEALERARWWGPDGMRGNIGADSVLRDSEKALAAYRALTGGGKP